MTNGAFAEAKPAESAVYDFDRIQQSGELIVVTLSGPDTYYDYQGLYMGMQYALVAHFAEKNGLRVRVEIAHDERELIQRLKKGEADIICYQLKEQQLDDAGLQAAGACSKERHTSWAVRKETPQLADALDEWFGQGLVVTVEKAEKEKMQLQHRVRRKVRAPYISKAKGIISTYDHYFKEAARLVGWDWKLIAAQCYQESGFDPSAESWAGAKGLMQLMPASAEHVGLAEHHIFEPAENVAAAARFLRELNGLFGDIPSAEERIKFVLAAYNGGVGHVRDAMALSRKHGYSARRWGEVAPFILKLSESRYYRDPVVKYGYMIGSETYNYVYAVWERWRAYGGHAAALGKAVPVAADGAAEKNVRKFSRFTKGTKIYRPDDPEFNQLNQP